MFNCLTKEQILRLENQQYRIVGNHSAVKICHWNKTALCGQEYCYKNDFYGIPSNKCLQMTPSLTCNQRCVHCWRDTSVFSKKFDFKLNNPKEIIEGCIAGRTELLSGFKGNPLVDEKLFYDSLKPTHAAISLTGEPTLYPKLPELINEFYKQKFKTIFLVTNATNPAMLKKIMELKKMPTNVYFSLEAANDKQHRLLNKPVGKSYWKKFNESLELMKKMKKTNTVIRFTAMKNMNMDNPLEYLPIIEKAKPKFLEIKSYMHVGYSRKRLQEENMPEFDEIKKFAEKIEENSSYKFSKERIDSRIVLLKRK